MPAYIVGQGGKNFGLTCSARVECRCRRGVYLPVWGGGCPGADRERPGPAGPGDREDLGSPSGTELHWRGGSCREMEVAPRRPGGGKGALRKYQYVLAGDGGGGSCCFCLPADRTAVRSRPAREEGAVFDLDAFRAEAGEDLSQVEGRGRPR